MGPRDLVRLSQTLTDDMLHEPHELSGQAAVVLRLDGVKGDKVVVRPLIRRVRFPSHRVYVWDAHPITVDDLTDQEHGALMEKLLNGEEFNLD